MTDIKYPQFLDFEASGLSDVSYPIEVAWNGANGSVESYLINTDCIADWTHWDTDAEINAHGICQDHLKQLGDPPNVIAKRMNERLAGSVLYVDAPDFDGFWLKRLFDAVKQTPTFKLGSAIELFDLVLNDGSKEMKTTQQDRFDSIMGTYGLTAWANINLCPHRAGNDVKHLMETYKLLCQSDEHLPKE